MNYMEKVAAMLNVPMNVELTLKRYDSEEYVLFTDEGLLPVSEDSTLDYIDLQIDLALVLTGVATLTEKPFKPVEGQKYWYYSITKKQDFHLESSPWVGTMFNILCFNTGNCYRSCEAAKKDEQRMKELLTYKS